MDRRALADPNRDQGRLSLKAAAARGVPIRLLTTISTGATQRHALDWLVRQANAHAAITYETQATRAHSEAWLFSHTSGFDTAHVRASNLTAR